MGLRYTKIGQDRNETTIVQGPLADILLAKQVPGTKAWADDIPGVALEWKITGAYPTGAWFGNMGAFASQEEAASYVAVMDRVASGVSASVASVPSTYQPGVGWVGDDWQKITPRDRGAGVGLKAILIGSSSDEYCSTAFANPLTATIFKQISDSWLSHVQSRFSIDLALHYNIGKSAEGSSAILALMVANEAKIDESDICFFRAGANDLRLGYTLASMLNTLEDSFSILISKGKKICIIVPHITQSSYDSGRLQNYIDTANWAYGKANKYPSLVCVADTLKEFGYAPNASALQDGTHLNDYGAYLASKAFEPILKLAPPAIDGIESYGKILFDSIVASAPTPAATTSCTKNQDGSITLVGNMNLQAVKATYTSVSLIIGKSYRALVEYTPNVSSGGGTYSAGIKVLSSTLTREFDFAIHSSQNNVNNVTGKRYRRIYPAFQATDSSHKIELYAGASFSFATFHRVVLVQID